jgi:hypothetical protein
VNAVRSSIVIRVHLARFGECFGDTGQDADKESRPLAAEAFARAALLDLSR